MTLPFRITRNSSVLTCSESRWQLDSFYYRYYVRERPVIWKASTYKILNPLPAVDKWATQRPKDKEHHNDANFDYLSQFGEVVVPLESTTWEDAAGKADSLKVKEFKRFEAPFSFFLDWTKQKFASPKEFSPNQSLYVAQCGLNLLPKQMQEDLPTSLYAARHKNITRKDMTEEGRKKLVAGGTAVQDSSLWMGIAPTETPLHKDPNDNILVQIAGRKVVRLMSHEDGNHLLFEVKKKIATEQGTGRLNMSMRGEEMMVGPERDVMGELVWKDGSDEGSDQKTKADMDDGEDIISKQMQRDELSNEELGLAALPGEEPSESTPRNGQPATSMSTQNEEATLSSISDSSDAAIDGKEADAKDTRRHIQIFEASLNPGDALFIPKGFYHSVRSLGDVSHGINISANWWFRFSMPTSKIQKMAAKKEKKEWARTHPSEAAKMTRKDWREWLKARAQRLGQAKNGAAGEISLRRFNFVKPQTEEDQESVPIRKLTSGPVKYVTANVGLGTAQNATSPHIKEALAEADRRDAEDKAEELANLKAQVRILELRLRQQQAASPGHSNTDSSQNEANAPSHGITLPSPPPTTTGDALNRRIIDLKRKIDAHNEAKPKEPKGHRVITSWKTRLAAAEAKAEELPSYMNKKHVESLREALRKTEETMAEKEEYRKKQRVSQAMKRMGNLPLRVKSGSRWGTRGRRE